MGARMFSGPDAASWLGLPYSTFDNWVRRNRLARVSVPAHGQGSRRQLTMMDVARTAVLLAVDGDPSSNGPKSDRLRRCSEALAVWPRLPRFVVITDTRVTQADNAASVVDIVLADPGVSTVVDVAKVLAGMQR